MPLSGLTANKKFLISAKLILGGAILAYIIFQLHPAVLYSSFLNGNVHLITIAVVLVIPNIGFQYWKWRYLVLILKPNASNSEIGGSLFAGFATGIITPARIGELAGRALYLRSVNKMEAVGLTIVDKTASLLITMSAGLLGVFYILLRLYNLSPYLWYPLFILLLLFVAVCTWLISHPPFAWEIVNAFDVNGSTHRRLKTLFESLRRMQSPQDLFLLSLSLLFYLTFLLQCVLLVQAFEQADIIESVAALAAAFFAKTVIPSVTFGELGIREGAALYFLSLFGYAASSAVNASLILFSCNVLFPSLIGLFFVPRLSLSAVNGKS